jgi:transforming growth factor-beta-induced protein
MVFVRGQGSRSTLTQAVSIFNCPLSQESGIADNFQDLMFKGGVVQVIDSLLIPPANLTANLNPFNLTAFKGALYTANKLESYLDAANSIIFVPQSDAFQALGPAIANMTVQELGGVLDYHLAGQVAYSTELTNGTKFLTQQGGNITILYSGNNLYVNSAQVLTPNTKPPLRQRRYPRNRQRAEPARPRRATKPGNRITRPRFRIRIRVSTLPFTTAIPCTSSCPVTSSSVSGSGSATAGAGTKATSVAGLKSSSSSVSTSSGKVLAAAVARETGFHAAGLMVALGGAVMMI